MRYLMPETRPDTGIMMMYLLSLMLEHSEQTVSGRLYICTGGYD